LISSTPYLVLFYIIPVINITGTLFYYHFVCIDVLWQCNKPKNQVNKVL